MSESCRYLAITLLLALAACDDPTYPGPGPGPTADPVPVEGLRVTPQSLQIMGIGRTAQLLAVVVPADATDQVLLWESTDSTIASVDGSGRVSGRRLGVGVIITAHTHDGGYESSANVAVVAAVD